MSMPVIIEGNVLNAKVDVIAHQTNCLGIMGGGVALAIRQKWPIVYNNYASLCNSEDPDSLLGTVLMVELVGRIPGTLPKYVANLFGQKGIGCKDGPATDYEALEDAMTDLRTLMRVQKLYSVAMPYGIGCGLAGGDWPTVEKIIHKVFGETDIRVELWKLP